jgi:hypothetical protein
MFQNKQTYANFSDNLDVLPTDQNPPSHSEIQIVDTLFKQQQNTIQTILLGFQDIVVIGVIFFIISLPFLDVYIKKFIPSSESSIYILL